MKLLRDVVCHMGKGKGFPLVSAKLITAIQFVPLAKGGKTPPTQTTTTNNAPWEGQIPYLKMIFGQAGEQYNREAGLGAEGGKGNAKPRQFYPGQTYASFSPQTEAALNLTEQRAKAGSQTQQAMNNELLKTLRGEYLYGGPGFNAAYQAAANKIIPDVESRFNRGGRLNSGLARQAETSALADAFASQYGNERANQLKAMLFAPQAAEADYADLSRLAGVGQAREGQAQSAIDEAMLRHEFEQMEPAERLARYMQMVQGNFGTTQTSTQTGFKGNKGAGILGGALAGAGAGAPFGPWGAGIGAGLGGLAGLF